MVSIYNFDNPSEKAAACVHWSVRTFLIFSELTSLTTVCQAGTAVMPHVLQSPLRPDLVKEAGRGCRGQPPAVEHV